MDNLTVELAKRYNQTMSQVADNTLEKFVDHVTRGFTAELAKHFAELPEPDPQFQAQLDELADKANEGILSAEEAKRYEKLIEYMDLVTLLRLKARTHSTSVPNE